MIFEVYFCKDERIFGNLLETFENLNFTKETHELESFLGWQIDEYKKS